MRLIENWIYLSPHLDDVALSCGGLIWEQSQAGWQTSVWTICAGDPPECDLSPFAQSLHSRWQTGLQAAWQRREEDIASCAALGSSFLHYPLPDCIYRQAGTQGQFIYDSEQAIFGPLHPLETQLIRKLSEDLTQRLPTGAQIICPLGLGGHVDHRLTRLAAESTARLLNQPVMYYADYPYVLRTNDELVKLLQSGWNVEIYPISAPGLAAWQAAIAAHSSQISTFWSSLVEMRAAIRAYCEANTGIRLCQPPDSTVNTTAGI